MPGSWSDYLELRTGDAPPPSPEGGDVRVYADGSGDLRAVQSDGTDAPVGGGGGSPGGVNNSLQYKDGSSFGGTSQLLAAANGIQFVRPGFGGGARISTDGVGVQLLIDCSDGDADNSGGELSLLSGGSSGGGGGDLTITAGTDNVADGGNITIQSGGSAAGDSGEINILAGGGSTAGNDGGHLSLIAGSGTASGGDVIVQGGPPDGNVQLYSGDSNQYVQLDNTGLQVGATALGFFQGAPVAQPALPVTLQDVIDALVALGLVAAT